MCKGNKSYETILKIITLLLKKKKNTLVNICMKGIQKMKEEYVKIITGMIEECEDVALLDLIFQLLKKEGYANT